MRSLAVCSLAGRCAAMGAALLLFSAGLHAQTPPPPDGGSTEVLQSIFIPPLPDAPFTLTLATEWVRPLGTDGNTVTLVNQRRIARDRAGRVYEERVLLRPSSMTGDWIVNVIQIADPATHTYLNCFTAQKVCRPNKYDPPVAPPNLESGTTPYQGFIEQRTNLGRDLMQGVDVTGMHVDTVIEAGVIGNAKPMTVTRDFWYSPALGINLRSVRDDPRSGKQTFTVTELSRDAPDPSLWQVPAGFTVASDSPAKP